MNNGLKPSEFTKAALAENSRELNQARADAALYERLKKASAEIAKLEKIGKQLTATLSKNLADEAKEERDALAATVQNISIVVDYPGANKKEDLIGARVTLLCEQMIYDMDSRDSVWTARSYDDLRELPPSVETALRLDLAKLLPSIILDLAPGDPEAALNRYCLARTRGYLAG